MPGFPAHTIILISILLACTTLNAGTDWGSRHDFQFKHGIKNNSYILIRSMVSTRDDFDDTYAGFGDAAFGYTIKEGLSVRAGYRLVRSRGGDEWLTENRPFIALSHSTNWNGFTISNRPRVEFREHDQKDDDIRLRHQVRIEPPWIFTTLEIRPYMEEEIFYSLNKDGISGNWLSFGITCKPTDHLKLKLGHRWISQKRGNDWIYGHILHTVVSFSY